MPEYNPTRLIIPRLGLGLTLSLISLIINLNVYNTPAEHPAVAWLTMTMGNALFIGIMYFQITFDDSLTGRYAHKVGLEPKDLNTPGTLQDILIHLDSGLCLILSGLCYSFSEVSTVFPGLWWLLGAVQVIAGAWCISATLPERNFNEELEMQAVRD
jgi:hypothetical protein